MIDVTLARPWLIARLPRPMPVLSWAPHGAGYRTTSRVVWREVRNADLGPGFDVARWFDAEMQAAHPGAVGLLTSRDIGTWRLASARVEGVAASCVVTLGLANAESVGQRLPYHAAEHGTINLCVAVDAAITRAAQLEAMSIAVQARTAAVIGAGLTLATGPATGTGTDCIALACDRGRVRHAGLHTALGEAVGAAVRSAVATAAADWLQARAAAGMAP